VLVAYFTIRSYDAIEGNTNKRCWSSAHFILTRLHCVRMFGARSNPLFHRHTLDEIFPCRSLHFRKSCAFGCYKACDGVSMIKCQNVNLSQNFVFI